MVIACINAILNILSRKLSTFCNLRQKFAHFENQVSLRGYHKKMSYMGFIAENAFVLSLWSISPLNPFSKDQKIHCIGKDSV